MLERMWSKGNIPPLLVGVQTYTATLKISMVVSQEIVNQSTLGTINTTLGHIPERCTLILQHCSIMSIAALLIIVRTWKQPRYLSTEEWVKKMRHIYTMEYYIVVKNKDILKFACKWVELEKKHPV